MNKLFTFTIKDWAHDTKGDTKSWQLTIESSHSQFKALLNEEEIKDIKLALELALA